jgi:transposase
VSSENYPRYFPHEKREKEAMEEMGTSRAAKGVLVYDYWKAYYGFTGKEHALCNAHLIRELTLAAEEGQKWAQPVIEYLYGLRDEVAHRGGKLGERRQEGARQEYRRLLRKGGQRMPPRGKETAWQEGTCGKTKESESA